MWVRKAKKNMFNDQHKLKLLLSPSHGPPHLNTLTALIAHFFTFTKSPSEFVNFNLKKILLGQLKMCWAAPTPTASRQPREGKKFP